MSWTSLHTSSQSTHRSANRGSYASELMSVYENSDFLTTVTRSSILILLLLSQTLLSCTTLGDVRSPERGDRHSSQEKQLSNHSERNAWGAATRKVQPAHGWVELCRDDALRVCGDTASDADLSVLESCLRSNLGSLTYECRTAFVGPPPSAAKGSRSARLAQACGDDLDDVCPEFESPRQGLRCLHEHEHELSRECRMALDERRNQVKRKGSKRAESSKGGGKGMGKGMGGRGMGGGMGKSMGGGW